MAYVDLLRSIWNFIYNSIEAEGRKEWVSVCLILICFLIYSSTISAQEQYTEIENVKIYSEYYPTVQTKFKGTILFENGSGTPLSEWTENKTFFQCAKQYGNLFMYDRNGLGKSSPDFSMSLNKPLTAEFVNSKLMQLLKKNNIRPPYILVAHSYGGMYVGYFARKYPKFVKGILMVDPVPNNYEWSDTFIKMHQAEVKEMSRLPSSKIYKQSSSSKSNTSPELFFQLVGFGQTKKQIDSLPPINKNIPIVIVSSSYMENNAPIKGNWYLQQQQWLNDNPYSKIIKVRSGHFIQIDQPRVICEQIETLVSFATK